VDWPSCGRQSGHINRYRQIATVLLKHGFGDLVTTVGLHRRLGLGQRPTEGTEPVQAALLARSEQIRRAPEELGPSFVKLGQITGTRPDMIPQELCLELEKLGYGPAL